MSTASFLPEHLIVARNTNDKGPLEIVEDTQRQGNELYNVFYFPEKVNAARLVTTLTPARIFISR